MIVSLYVPTLQWLAGSQGELAIHGVRLDLAGLAAELIEPDPNPGLGVFP